MDSLNESIKTVILNEKSITLKGDIARVYQQMGYLEKEIKRSNAKNERLMLETLKALKRYFGEVEETAKDLDK